MSSDEYSALLLSAERQIETNSGVSVRLVDPEVLPSPHVLLRCRVEGASGRSVIVKQVTTTQFTSDEDTGTSHRLLTEWASLRFLGSLHQKGPWPGLLAASREESFVVIEDLGSHPTVEEMLLSEVKLPVDRLLESIGTSLGRLHGAAHGRTSQFISTRAELGGSSPVSDSTYDLRKARNVFEDCFETLEVTPAPGFWEELISLESSLHGPGLFTTLIHADAGPQNFMWTGRESVLVDFEFATVGNALLDLVSARLGFPHSADAYSVPPPLVERLESAYRHAVSDAIPQVEDEATFQRGIVDACAHWALVRLGGLWRRLFLDVPDATGDVEKMRSQACTVYRRFVATAEGIGHREQIAVTLDRFTETIEQRVPGLTERPVYPALASPL